MQELAALKVHGCLPYAAAVCLRSAAVGFVEALSCDLHGQKVVAFDEARVRPLGFANDFNLLETLQDLFPDDLQLQLRKSHADAAVYAEAERQVVARPLAIDDEQEALRRATQAVEDLNALGLKYRLVEEPAAGSKVVGKKPQEIGQAADKKRAARAPG